MLLDYIDFDLSIDRRESDVYELSARSEIAGEATPRPRVRIDVSSFASDLAALHTVLRNRRAYGSASRDVVGVSRASGDAVKGLGTRLFDSVMVDSVVERYRVALEKAQDRQQGLRIRLRIQASELAALPWEFMWDRRQAAFVCSRQTTIVRHLEFDREPGELQIALPLRILGLVSAPTDHAPLNKSAEQERMHRALQGLQESGRVALTWLKEGTFAGLQASLRQQEWHVLHYLGHGGVDPKTNTGLLVLEREDGTSHLVGGDDLGQLLRGNPSLRLVVLNSCEGARVNDVDVFSSTAGALVRSGIPAVIAMQYPITDVAAIDFAQAFYAALADEQPVDAAVSDARLQLRTADAESVEWGTPVIFMRPNRGVLFRTPEQKQPHFRWLRKAWPPVAGGAAATLIALSVMAFSHSSAVVDADLTTDFIGFTLDHPARPGISRAGQRLTDLPWDVERASAVGIGETHIPGDGNHASEPVTSDYLIVERRSNAATLSLDLSQAELSPGTHITLGRSDVPGQYTLSLARRLPAIGLTMRGPMEISDDGGDHDRVYSVPTRLMIPPGPPGNSADSLIDLTLRPITVPAQLGVNVRVQSLTVMQAEEDETGAPTRWVSALKSGSLVRHSSRDSLKLTAFDSISFVKPSGVLRVAFVDTSGVRVSFSGTTEGLEGRVGRRVGNLMPTRLAALGPLGAILVMTVTASAGAGLGLAAADRLRRKRRIP